MSPCPNPYSTVRLILATANLSGAGQTSNCRFRLQRERTASSSKPYVQMTLIISNAIRACMTSCGTAASSSSTTYSMTAIRQNPARHSCVVAVLGSPIWRESSGRDRDCLLCVRATATKDVASAINASAELAPVVVHQLLEPQRSRCIPSRLESEPSVVRTRPISECSLLEAKCRRGFGCSAHFAVRT